MLFFYLIQQMSARWSLITKKFPDTVATKVNKTQVRVYTHTYKYMHVHT